MSSTIFSTVCEAKAIRESEFILGRKERISLALPGTFIFRRALSKALMFMASFFL
ncbi:MAG: hypothetical protein P1S60_00365 [Anaerolineae bacterium]|nr:hypothetical protein [Anaerolineae bacterium]